MKSVKLSLFFLMVASIGFSVGSTESLTIEGKGIKAHFHQDKSGVHFDYVFSGERHADIDLSKRVMTYVFEYPDQNHSLENVACVQEADVCGNLVPNIVRDLDRIQAHLNHADKDYAQQMQIVSHARESTRVLFDRSPNKTIPAANN